MLPSVTSQNLAANFAAVLFPPPDKPTKAVICPCFAVKDTSFKTFSLFLLSYENAT